MSGLMVPMVDVIGSTLGMHMPAVLNIVNMAGNPAYNAMDVGQALARAYNIGILPTGGEATDMDQCRQYAARLAAGLKPHFSTALATIAASGNAVGLFNGQELGKVNFPDLVAAGLVTADSARSLEEAVAKQAQTMADSAVSVFREGNNWWSWAHALSRITTYAFAGFWLRHVLEPALLMISALVLVRQYLSVQAAWW